MGGKLSVLSASQLGGIAIRGALRKADMKPTEVDEVIMGSVLQGGQGQLPSRQAARHAGLPWTVKTETVNKVCASGMRAVTLADQIIRSGDGEVIVAGGMESMSNAPYLLEDARQGYRMGDKTVRDMMIHDGLTCSFTGAHMGVYGNQTAKKFGISRKSQDEWALRSHRLAIKAAEAGWLAEEIIGVEIPGRKGKKERVIEDESPRKDTSIEKLGKLNPVFGASGSITAGNAPGVHDGAAVLVLMDGDRAVREDRVPLARLLAHEEIAVEPERFPETPGLVIRNLLQKAEKDVSDIDLFEMNEAFAAVALVSTGIAGLSESKVNVNGGAVALGHPIGASGARIILTLAKELKRRGGGVGIAAICSGGGQGDAVLIEVTK